MSQVTNGTTVLFIDTTQFKDLLLALDRTKEAKRMIGEWSTDDCQDILLRMRKLRRIAEAPLFDELIKLLVESVMDCTKVVFK